MRPHVRPLIANLTVLTALLWFASCSSDDPTQPDTAIHQSYVMEYDVARDRTTGKASLRASSATGAQIRLTPPAAILYNGVAMDWSNTEPNAYTRIQPGRIESGVFEFTDGGGNVRTNVVTLSSVDTIALPAGVNELIITSQATIAWQGAPVSAGESVSLTFNTAANGLATFYQQSTGATSIVLTPANLTLLGAGTATWRLERTTYLGLQASTESGGRIAIRWSTGDRPVTIK